MIGFAKVFRIDTEEAQAACLGDKVLSRNVSELEHTIAVYSQEWHKRYPDGLNELGETLPYYVAMLLGRPLPIIAVFADGGLLGTNRKVIGCVEGGTYAFCHIDIAGRRVYQEAGLVSLAEANGIGEPDALGQGVTNNLSELMAMVRCLRAVPEGYAGEVYTDSQCTLSRVFGKNPKRFDNMKVSTPGKLVDYLPRLTARLGPVTPILLAGHSDEDPGALERGYSDRKNDKGEVRTLPNSIHNVWCDKACNEVRDRFWSLKRVPESLQAVEQAPAAGPAKPRRTLATPEAGEITTL